MHEEVFTDSYGRQGTIFLAVTQHLHMTGAIPLLVPSLLGTLCCGSGSLCCGYPVVGVRPKYICNDGSLTVFKVYLQGYEDVYEERQANNKMSVKDQYNILLFCSNIWILYSRGQKNVSRVSAAKE